MVVLAMLPPFLVMFFRFGIAFAALSVIVSIEKSRWKSGKKQTAKKKSIDRKGWKYVLILGIFGYAVSVGLQLVGTRYAGSSMASLINSLNPITISLMAVPILHEKLTRNKVAGIILAVFGVYLIMGNSGNVSIPGVLLSLLSVTGWSLVSVITRRGLDEYESLVITRAAVGIAAICELPIAAIEYEATHPKIVFSPLLIPCLLYLGIICTGVAYYMWNQGLAVLPASNCSALYPIQPLTAAFMGIILFHEKIEMSFFFGAGFIISGVLITLLCGKRKMVQRQSLH